MYSGGEEEGRKKPALLLSTEWGRRRRGKGREAFLSSSSPSSVTPPSHSHISLFSSSSLTVRPSEELSYPSFALRDMQNDAGIMSGRQLYSILVLFS